MNNHCSGGSCGCLLLFPEIQGHCASRYTAVYIRDEKHNLLWLFKKRTYVFVLSPRLAVLCIANVHTRNNKVIEQLLKNPELVSLLMQLSKAEK